MEQIPKQNKIETKEKQTEIVLHFFRHSEKESDKNKSDKEINLTFTGRKMAIENSSPDTDIGQSVAFGSPKKRTQETALYHMLGIEDDVDGIDTFDELKEKVNQELKIGSKVGIDKNLDFPDIESSQYKQMVYDAFNDGSYISFLVHKSDKVGVMVGSGTETYSFKAAQVAKIIQKYLSVLPRWETLLKDEKKKYEPQLERFLGTHQGIQECFLSKLLELTDGIDERDKFIKSLPSGNGFDYNEGMNVKILKDVNGSEYVQIEYKGEEYEISKSINPNLILEIANKENFENKEKHVKVVNALEKMNRPSLQSIEGGELTPENSIDIDARALENPNCVSVIYGRPHAGEYVPEEIWDRTTKEGKEVYTIVDRGTNEIFKSEKIPSIGTKISRYFVDLNRNPYQKEASSVPGSVTWLNGAYDEAIFQEGKAPTTEESSTFVENYYAPYQEKANGLIGAVADRRKSKQQRVLVIDGHSFSTTGDTMNSYFKLYGVEKPKELPMFIIGDGGGYSCDQDILDSFMETLKKNFEELDEESKVALKENVIGDIVGLNHPFKGAHNVKYYGERNHSINGIQLECNESLYIDETNDDYSTGKYDFSKLNLVKKLIEKTCEDIDYLLKNKKHEN